MKNSFSPEQDFNAWNPQRLLWYKSELEDSTDGRDRHVLKRVSAILNEKTQKSKNEAESMASVYFQTRYGIEDENFANVDADMLADSQKRTKERMLENISDYPFVELFIKYPDGAISDFEVVWNVHWRTKIRTSQGDEFVFNNEDVNESSSVSLMDAYVLINERVWVYSDQYPTIPKWSIITDVSKHDCDFRVDVKDRGLRDQIYGDLSFWYGTSVTVQGQDISIAPFAMCKISEVHDRESIEYSLHMS